MADPQSVREQKIKNRKSIDARVHGAFLRGYKTLCAKSKIEHYIIPYSSPDLQGVTAECFYSEFTEPAFVLFSEAMLTRFRNDTKLLLSAAAHELSHLEVQKDKKRQMQLIELDIGTMDKLKETKKIPVVFAGGASLVAAGSVMSMKRRTLLKLLGGVGGAGAAGASVGMLAQRYSEDAVMMDGYCNKELLIDLRAIELLGDAGTYIESMRKVLKAQPKQKQATMDLARRIPELEKLFPEAARRKGLS